VTTTPVPTHAEATGERDVVRWVLPAGLLPVDGAVTTAPGALGRMLDDGTLADVRVEAGALLIRSGGAPWRTLGGPVRSALQESLAAPDGWVVGDGAGAANALHAGKPDDALATALDEVLAGPTGDFIRSHGGQVEVVAVADRCVDVRLSGACAHCPAAFFTLHGRLEQDLRTRYPELVELRAGGSAPSLPAWLRRASTIHA
jgi:Fe-S cluster biogenesis protein NfuA